VGEADVVVVDALVGRPELLALLERNVAPVALPQGRRLDLRLPPQAGAHEAVGIGAPEVGEPPAVAETEACDSGACRGSTTRRGRSSC
jgi:hypothetical protein